MSRSWPTLHYLTGRQADRLQLLVELAVTAATAIDALVNENPGLAERRILKPYREAVEAYAEFEGQPIPAHIRRLGPRD